MRTFEYEAIAEHIHPAAVQLPDDAQIQGLADTALNPRPRDALSIWYAQDTTEQARIWEEWVVCIAGLSGEQRPAVRNSLDLATKLGFGHLRVLRSYGEAQMAGMATNRGLIWGKGGLAAVKDRIIILEAFGKTHNPININRDTLNVPNNPYF